MIVLIPAYEPDERLPRLVAELHAAGAEILVVDDGSGPRHREVFEAAVAAGAELLVHPRNLGKGQALKTGLARLQLERPGEDIVTADADGQHTVRDILRVGAELQADAQRRTPVLVLGCRAVTGKVPLRSRLGNAAARATFLLAAGWRLSDTQTGLRGIPAAIVPWLLAQPGNRFEYEQQVLLRAHRDGIGTREVPIRTVYLGRNESSHFRPVRDSLRVMAPVARFALSSFAAFLIDTAALLVLQWLTGWLIGSIVGARLLSAACNFVINRRLVFAAHRDGGLRRQITGYLALAAALLASNLLWLSALTAAGMPLLPAKLLTEAVLFLISFGVQRTTIFGAAGSLPGTYRMHSQAIVEHASMVNKS